MGLLLALLVAAIVGSLGARLGGRQPMGCLLSIVLGFIGASLGRWMSETTGIGDPWTITAGGQSFPVLWSIAGAAVFVALLNLISGQGPRR